MPMPTRKIGQTDVSAIGFGAMGIGGFTYGKNTLSDEERFPVLDRAYELGCTFWDTANIYGDSESLIGKWFHRTGKRSSIFLATKFGYTMAPSRGPGEALQYSYDGSAENVRASFAESLRRLGTDYVDLFYAHRVDPSIPIELTIRAMAELVKAGKVKYLGLSECSEDSIRRAHAIHPISAVQVEYAPITLDIESPRLNVLRTCRELGIAVVPWSPLGRGVLTGQFKSPDEFAVDDYRRYIPRFSHDNFPKVLALANKLRSIGSTHTATAGQVCLAWVLAQGADFLPIPGTKSVKYLEENVGAVDVRLSPEEVAEIRQYAHECGAAEAPRRLLQHEDMCFNDSPPLTE